MIEKLREELIKDIISYLNKVIPHHVSDENNEVHNTITQIIVDTFDDYELKVKEWGRLPDHDESTVEDSMAQEAKFELVNYKLRGTLTEYLVRLHDADGEVVDYHITDYYNKDVNEITSTRIWKLVTDIEEDNFIGTQTRLGQKILTFITSEHFYRNDVLESMYVKEQYDEQ